MASYGSLLGKLNGLSSQLIIKYFGSPGMFYGNPFETPGSPEMKLTSDIYA